MELVADRLTLRRGGAFTLGPISLRFEAGTHAAITGGAASGKSTLLKALAGLIAPDEGRVTWDAADPWQLDPEDRRRRQAAFGMVFQTDALFDSMTVLQNVELPLLKRGVAADEAKDRASKALRQVRLEHAADQVPEHLSGGMKKRAGIARAIVAAPQILLADDPLAGLDPNTALKVAEALIAAAAGKTLIVALPDPVADLALPRQLRLERGCLAEDRGT